MLVQTLAFLLVLAGMAVSAAACEGGGGPELTTLSTKLSGESKEGETITVLEGSKVKDKATLKGKNAATATGKVIYKVYTNSECKTLVTTAGEVTVSGESVPASSEEELEGGASYYWQAHYTGDSKNAESTSECTEISTVKAKTSLSTKLSGESKEGEELTVLESSKAKDKATLSGTKFSTAGGKVTYKIYSDKECKTLFETAGEVTLETGAKIPASTEKEPEAGKTYYWQAHYEGDSLHQESTSTCGSEVLKVKAKTTLTTKLSGEGKEGEELTIIEGAKIKDTATLGGTNSSSAEGKVLYKIYSDSKCEHLVEEAGEVAVIGGSVGASNEVELESGATYYWQATYKGDGLHQESISTCGKEIAKVNPASVVSVGDSFISGEAGRFAGNTNTLGSGAVDALGETAYFDNPTHTQELIEGCHRSRSAEIYIGGNVEGENLACSGALTYSTVTGAELFKPGLDFEFKRFGQGVGGGTCNLEVCEGQALMLQHYAEEHNNIRMVAISTGGNNFEFEAIVEACISAYIASSTCSTNAAVTNRVNAAAVAARVTEIEAAITHVSEAMKNAGYNNNQYTILVQNYPELIPSEELYRYGEGGFFERQRVGGCGFTNADANWANSTALPAINGAVKTAAAGVGLANVKEMNITNAFVLNLLCFSGVGLLEERGLTAWTEEGAANETEWVSQARISPAAPYTRQEGLHPNYWAQLALRNCLRQAYNRGKPKGGNCELEAPGLTLSGEPRMSLG